MQALSNFVVPVPDGLHNTNIGNVLADSLPLTTMLCCVPTLGLYWRRSRFRDLVVFSIGFFLACVYHICHMAEEGLVASRVLGVSGPVWRSLDVLFAQWLLGRTFGHAIGASHKLTEGTTNVAFPAGLLYYGLTRGAPSVGVCAQILGLVLCAGLAAKFVLEGASTLPQYSLGRGLTTLGCIVGAFVSFPMPEIFPRQYWLFHSAWHVLLSAGIYELYAMLEGEDATFVQQISAALSAAWVRTVSRFVTIRERTLLLKTYKPDSCPDEEILCRKGAPDLDACSDDEPDLARLHGERDFEAFSVGEPDLDCLGLGEEATTESSVSESESCDTVSTDGDGCAEARPVLDADGAWCSRRLSRQEEMASGVTGRADGTRAKRGSSTRAEAARLWGARAKRRLGSAMRFRGVPLRWGWGSLVWEEGTAS